VVVLTIIPVITAVQVLIPAAMGGHTPGSKGGSDKGKMLSGKYCRINQIIYVKVDDNATPGKDPDGTGDLKGDGLTWKCFASGYNYDISSDPKKLCRKEIIAGNLVVHNKK